MIKKNLILVDIPKADKTWNLYKELCKLDIGEWIIKSYGKSLKKGKYVYILRVISYFIVPLCVIFNIKKYNVIFAGQQFYGLNLAFFMCLFHLRKNAKLIIHTFIYKPKHGFIGYIYKKYMHYVVESKYIDCFIVRSSSEIIYYEELFGTKGKFKYAPFAMYATAPSDTTPSDDKYIFGVGRSNRDWDFLCESIKGTSYKAIIACDNYTSAKNPNVTILNNCFNEQMHDYLAKCYAVVIPLKDKNISAGQMAFLEAMEYGKPVIVTESKGVTDYIQNNVTGFFINNTKKDLLNVLDTIYNDENLYDRVRVSAQKFVRQEFTPYKMDVKIVEIVKSVI